MTNGELSKKFKNNNIQIVIFESMFNNFGRRNFEFSHFNWLEHDFWNVF